MSARAEAALCLAKVLAEGQSLSACLPPALARVAARDQGLVQELCYGSLRWFHRYNSLLNQLLERPFKPRDADLQALLLIGVYQLDQLRVPDHAAIDTCVEAARELGKPWAAGLVNGLLRRVLRDKAALFAQLDADAAARHAHPKWLIKALTDAWPDRADAILAANNHRPPMALRLAPALDRGQYLTQLRELGMAAQAGQLAGQAIVLDQACDPTALPGFAEGLVSVQDQAAQLAGELLSPAPGDRVLDCCCAPGGKTLHLLQANPGIELVALDADPRRLVRVRENLARARLDAVLLCGDAARPETWWDGRPFQHILLDAPCSATGVIRRHPDIKLLRKPGDIAKLAALQGAILSAIWPLLAPGGTLLYATCSSLPAENADNLVQFLGDAPDARELPLPVSWGLAQGAGRQLLPGQADSDGFYYCKLQKQHPE